MSDVVPELGHSVRFARRNPGAGAPLILTFAISVAATTTVLSVVYFVFVRDLSYRDPGSLVRVAKLFPQRNPENTSYTQLLDWRARTETLESLAAIRWEDATVLRGVNPQRMTAGLVTANLFPMLGVNPLLGRLFERSDEQPGANARRDLSGAAVPIG